MVATATARPIDRALELFPDAKGPHNDWYSCRCVAHNDKNPSLSFKATGDENDEDGEGIIFTCFAGCSRQAILDALNLTEQELHYRSGSSNSSAAPRQKRTPTLTLMDLASAKLLLPTYLMSLGIDDGESVYHRKEDGQPYTKKGVVIPYFTEDGQPYTRYRLRTALKAKDGTIWNEKNEENSFPLIPYGLHKLDMARKSHKLIIVEGESDCWTLWQFGFPALGIPGANNYATIKLAYLKAIDTIYILQEPDPAGQTFPVKVKRHLESIGYKGKIYAVDLTEFESAKDPNDLHLKLVAKHNSIKSFQPTVEKALLQAIPLFVPGQEPEKPTIFTLQDLMKKEIPPVKWVIPDILPEGLFLLSGKPKLGKSWLGFDIGLAIAFGGYVMGKIKIEKPGEVLYLALEDHERRIQSRMKKLLQDVTAPAGFHISIGWPRIDKGGAELLEEEVQKNPNLRIIIVDTWTKLSPRITGKQQSLYESQYDALVPLKAIADKYAISIVAVHHNRKMSADDVVDEISGTTGLTGSVDGFWILRRERGQTDAVLHITGRDIEEDQALAINFDASEARWKLEGNAEDFAKTKERQAILDLIALHPEGMRARDISEQLGKPHNTVRNLLVRLREEEKLVLTKDIYTLYRSQHSQSSKDSQRSQHSQASDSFSQNSSKPDYGSSRSDYGEDPTVVRPDTYADGHAKPNNNRSSGTPDYADYGNYAHHKNRTSDYPGKVIARMMQSGLVYPKRCADPSHKGETRWFPYMNPATGKYDEWRCCKCCPALIETKGKYLRSEDIPPESGAAFDIRADKETRQASEELAQKEHSARQEARKEYQNVDDQRRKQS